MSLDVTLQFRNVKTAMLQPAEEKTEIAFLSSDFAENLKITRKNEVSGVILVSKPCILSCSPL